MFKYVFASMMIAVGVGCAGAPDAAEERTDEQAPSAEIEIADQLSPATCGSSWEDPCPVPVVAQPSPTGPTTFGFCHTGRPTCAVGTCQNIQYMTNGNWIGLCR